MIRSISFFFVAMPFLFGLLRAVISQNDFRYLWVGAASLCGAAAFTVATHAPNYRRRIALSIGAFIAATLSAIVTAMLLGTRFGPAVLFVAASFGFCSAAGCTLFAITQRHGPHRSADEDDRRETGRIT